MELDGSIDFFSASALMYGHTPAAKYIVRLLELTMLTVMLAGRAQAYIANDRWTRTATNTSTGSQGTPITVTWSIAPDGTTLATGNSSTLIGFLDTTFGAGPGGSDLTQRPWFTFFNQAYDRINNVGGVTYVYEPNDDGRSYAQNNSARGVLGVRGDTRIGGYSFGNGSNTLATNFFPDYGEMTINTDQAGYFTNTTNNYSLFRNTLMHEAMHGLGISHVGSSNAGFLIEPIVSNLFDGPQLDDILAIQRLYGDIYEKNGGNDTFSQATPLGQLSPTQQISIGSVGNSTVISPEQVDILSIDDDSDIDFFSFSLDTRLDVSLRAEPRGTTYLVGPEDGVQTNFNTLELSNLSLALFDTNGTSLLSLADTNPVGGPEQITPQLLPGTYYARVSGAQNDIQLYNFSLTGTVPSPANLMWVGNISQNWDVATTANFSNGTAPVRFFELDNVRFDDSSAVKTVNLPASVTAGNMEVVTESTYVFTGPGGIVAGSLTVDGGGSVELANSGNSFSGTTVLRAGTLKIAGETQFDGALHIEQEAELQLAGPYQFEPTARLSGTGRVSGDLLMPGTIAPGDSPGMLTLDNSLTLAETSRLEIELGGTEAGTQYDWLSIGGFAELDGTLDVSLINDFVPAAGESVSGASCRRGHLLAIRSCGAAGTCSGICVERHLQQLCRLAPGCDTEHRSPCWRLQPRWHGRRGRLCRVAQHAWAIGAGLPADGNGNGEIDAGDYEVWRANFGKPSGPGAAAYLATGDSPRVDSAVPEPASIGLWMFTLPLLIRIGRTR